jgi:hypothetical protein
MISTPSAKTDEAGCSIEPNMIDVLWTPAFLDHLSTEDKCNAIRRIIKECDRMNATNKNYQITRREAIGALAKLPMITLGLTIPGAVVQPKRYGDALEHCAVALEGCSELYWSNDASDILLAFQYVSKYLPILKTIAQDSSAPRCEALDLAARYALLKALLGSNCIRMTEETTSYSKDAVALCNMAGDISLQLNAYRTLARRYFDNKNYMMAHRTIQEGECVLKDYQKMSDVPKLSSSVTGWFYSTYALVQTKSGEAPDVALGIATDSESSSTPTTSMLFTESTRLREAALICCYHGDQEQAMRWLAQRMDLETLAPRIPQSEFGRIEAINILTLSMLKSKERDMEKIIHHWTAGIEGAKTLRHEHGFSEAVANFEAMEFVWPGEKRIKNLRTLIVHW